MNAGKIRDLRYFTDPFQETQRLVRWHYQWIIVHEFLPFIIDHKVLAEVFDLPFSSPSGEQSLPLRTLLRGQSCGLPSGEMVACFLGIEPLSPDQTGIARYELEQIPLWFYILKEAELNKEDKLGPVGGRIVAEVFMGILKGDSQSYLSVAPHWEPCLPSVKKGDFTIADLIKLAQSISE